jgi:hypothetical protein
MGRAFGELDASFYDSGRVLSQRTCVDAPLRRPQIARTDRNVVVSADRFTETLSLGVPECVELGGYYAFALDSADDHADYSSYEVEA